MSLIIIIFLCLAVVALTILLTRANKQLEQLDGLKDRYLKLKEGFDENMADFKKANGKIQDMYNNLRDNPDDRIFELIRNNERLVYYTEAYNQGADAYEAHYIGIAGWTEEECKDYGIVITGMFGSRHVAEDIIDMLAQTSVDGMKDYKINIEGTKNVLDAIEKVDKWEENNEPID